GNTFGHDATQDLLRPTFGLRRGLKIPPELRLGGTNPVFLLQETCNPGNVEQDRIGFSAGRESALVMRNDVPDGVAAGNLPYQVAHGFELAFRERIGAVV